MSLQGLQLVTAYIISTSEKYFLSYNMSEKGLTSSQNSV